MRATGSFSLEHPIKARLITLLEPVADDWQARGGLKDPIYYLRSVLPIGDTAANVTGLETSAMNPLASATQMPKMAIGAFAAERGELAKTPGTTLSPIAQATLAFLTGRDQFRGQEIDAPAGRVGALVRTAVKAFPQTRVAESYLSPEATTSRGEPKLSQPGGLGPLTGQALRYLGVPIKTISKAAHERAKREEKLKAMAPPQRGSFPRIGGLGGHPGRPRL